MPIPHNSWGPLTLPRHHQGCALAPDLEAAGDTGLQDWVSEAAYAVAI